MAECDLYCSGFSFCFLFFFLFLTVAPVPSSRTANRCHAPGRDSAPLSPTGTEDGQGRGGGSRDACLARQWIHILRLCLAFERIFAHFLRRGSLRSHAEWRNVLSRCFSVLSLSRCSHFERGHYFNEFHVAESCDDGVVFFWGQLCQTQVPVGAGTPGVSLVGVPALCTIRL